MPLTSRCFRRSSDYVAEPDAAPDRGSLDIETSGNDALNIMRTTLTIDDDVAIALDRVRERDALSLKAVVNQALRRGLRVMDAEREHAPQQRYHVRAWRSGGIRVSVDNVAEALDWAEGHGRR
jgi:hypothetical protein